jgi:Rieske Fe-S protein
MATEPTSDTDASRRSFLGNCTGLFGIAVIGGSLAPLLSSCGSPRIAATTAADGRIAVSIAMLVADGMTAVVDHPGSDGKGIIVVREALDRYLALSMRCTHKGCAIAPPNDDNVMVCPCHDSRFDLAGAVVKAPATTPLKRYDTALDPDARTLYITVS